MKRNGQDVVKGFVLPASTLHLQGFEVFTAPRSFLHVLTDFAAHDVVRLARHQSALLTVQNLSVVSPLLYFLLCAFKRTGEFECWAEVCLSVVCILLISCFSIP